MPMIFADESDAVKVRTLDLEQVDIQRQLGAWSLIRQIATAVGLRDPLNVYEPGVPLPTVFSRYTYDLKVYTDEVERLRVGTTQEDLRRQIYNLKAERESLVPAFASGAEIGDRDRTRLGDWVMHMREFRKDLAAARQQYGLAAPAPLAVIAAPTPPAARQTAARASKGFLGGNMTMILLVGGGALALALLLKRR